MGLIDSMKNTFRSIASGQWGSTPSAEGAKHDYTRGYERTTTASRREAELEARVYAHVSKEIPEEVTLAMQMGLPGVAEALTRRAPGQTYYSPVAAVKREADKLASQLGFNNKQRRRLRGHMVERYREVHA